MVPVIRVLKAKPKLYRVKVCVTAQHRELLDQVLENFSVKPDFDLDLMSAGQDLYDVTARVLGGMKTVIGQTESDLVLVRAARELGHLRGSQVESYAGVCFRDNNPNPD